MTFRPIGDCVLVMFPQGEWERVGEFVEQKTLVVGEPFHMNGLVVAVGSRVPEIRTGMTVYGDPRKGRVIVIDRTMYHIMRFSDLEMKAQVIDFAEPAVGEAVKTKGEPEMATKKTPAKKAATKPVKKSAMAAQCACKGGKTKKSCKK